MKAYVIKNKEGKYCQITFNGYIIFVSELCCAYIYHSKQGAEKLIKCHELEDCEVVGITIAEGDLEQQLAIIKRALLKASKEAFGNKTSFVSSNYSKKITNSEEYAEYLIFEAESEVKNGN